MFCLKCGKEIPDSSVSCPFCGCPTENSGEKINASMVNGTSAANGDGLGTAAIALGVIGAILAFLIALLGYIFGGTALALALVGRSRDKNSKKCFAGVISAIVALGCSLLSSIIGVMLMTM